MMLFEGFFISYVLDAEGRPRRLYPLWAWWRSPRVRGDVPREVYAAICAEALRRGEARRAEAAATLASVHVSGAMRGWPLWAHRILMAALIVYLLRHDITSPRS